MLAKIRHGEFPSDELVRDLGESCGSEFFREVIEPLGDSFSPAARLLFMSS